MDKLTRQAENEKFHEWYLKSGYHYKPETDEEGDWVVTVRYWAWKAWEERASISLTQAEIDRYERWGKNEMPVQDNVTEALEKHIGELV